MTETLKACRLCGLLLAPIDYHSYTHTATGKRYWSKTCKTCVATEKRRGYHTDATARAKQIMYSMESGVKRKWPAAWTGSLVAEGIAMMLEQFPCFYCALPDDGTTPFALDHYMPLALGGLHSMDNLRSACERCNRAKHDSPPLAYLAWLEGVRARK